jgi:hypothetical protein
MPRALRVRPQLHDGDSDGPYRQGADGDFDARRYGIGKRPLLLTLF